MGYQLDVRLKETYLYFSLTGEHDPDQVLKDFGRLLDACTETGMSKVLIDYRNLKNIPPGVVDRYQYMWEVNRQYIDFRTRGGGTLRFAYLAPPELITPINLYLETVAESFGFPAIETADLDEALRWLDE